MIDLVRYAMSSGGADAKTAAQFVGINDRPYSLIRKLLILKARQVLTREEEDTVGKALEILQEGHFNPAKKLVSGILSRHWIEKTIDGVYRHGKIKALDEKKRKRLEKTIFIIRESCTNNDEMEIPLALSRTERQELSESLIDSIGALCKLISKIRGDYQ